ncbi:MULTISPECIES: hypothetical protein [unclassified Streptomyces]
MAFDTAWAAYRTLAANFQRQEGTVAAVSGKLVLETRQLLMELAPLP